MSNNNWYDAESWYDAPQRGIPRKIESSASPVPPPKKHNRTTIRVIGIICLVVVLIVASSLAFAGGEKKAGGIRIPTETDSGSFDDSWEDFFDKYYNSVDTPQAQTNIVPARLPIDYTMELAPQGEDELSLKEIYEKYSSSIVAISAYKDGQSGYNWGTGVILSEDGLVLTNTHVIDKCDSAKVTLFDDSVYNASLVGADAISDIAVLKIRADNLQPAVFGESGILSVGDSVAAIGNPLGETFRSTMTDGIISAIERGITYQGNSMTLLQTNTAINEGNSGGALFNKYGQVIGITNMKIMSSYSSVEGIGFAIPSSTVKDVVNSLVQYGEVKGRTSIGITVGGIPDEAAEHYDLPYGLYVSAVAEGSDAEKQGIKAGDIITHVNGTPVRVTEDISDLKDGLQVGDTMRFTVWRDGETFDVNVTLMDTNDIYG